MATKKATRLAIVQASAVEDVHTFVQGAIDLLAELMDRDEPAIPMPPIIGVSLLVDRAKEMAGESDLGNEDGVMQRLVGVSDLLRFHIGNSRGGDHPDSGLSCMAAHVLIDALERVTESFDAACGAKAA